MSGGCPNGRLEIRIRQEMLCARPEDETRRAAAMKGLPVTAIMNYTGASHLSDPATGVGMRQYERQPLRLSYECFQSEEQCSADRNIPSAPKKPYIPNLWRARCTTGRFSEPRRVERNAEATVPVHSRPWQCLVSYGPLSYIGVLHALFRSSLTH